MATRLEAVVVSRSPCRTPAASACRLVPGGTAFELRAGQAIECPGPSAAQVPIHPPPIPVNGLIAAALDLKVCQPLVYWWRHRNDRRVRSLNGQGLERALRQIGNGVVVRGDFVS